MNHGYAQAADEDFAWLEDADQPWRFSLNLIRRALDDAPTTGARVLDIGCGRGGPASYIARYLNAGEVTGLDACADSIAFCQRRHLHPRAGLRARPRRPPRTSPSTSSSTSSFRTHTHSFCRVGCFDEAGGRVTAPDRQRLPRQRARSSADLPAAPSARSDHDFGPRSLGRHSAPTRAGR
jgi:SAM-dependent methyltransferase